MAKMGSDPQELRQLKTKFTTEAGKLDEVITGIKSKLDSTYWEGPDATRFRSNWEGQYAKQLKQAATELRQAGEKVGRQAEQQESASS